MVNIIDPTPDPSVAKKVTCRSCGVKLQYLPIEVQRRDGHDYSGGPDGEEYITCPNCNQRVILRSW